MRCLHFYCSPQKHRYHCHGKYIRRICHLSMLDMDEIYRRNTLEDGRQSCFVGNKFDFKIDANAIICAAKRIHLQESYNRKSRRKWNDFEVFFLHNKGKPSALMTFMRYVAIILLSTKNNCNLRNIFPEPPIRSGL